MTSSALFGPVQPFASEHLQVSDLHSLYLEQSGNPDGKPIIFIHGGPGGGCSAEDRSVASPRFFDPANYHVILFDQRGSGKSTPPSCLEENTTWHLVEDIEKIRQHLKIDKWVVFGGSWGSTLSLAYAQAHPARVKGLILRGIFALRRAELEFFYQGPGTSFIFPEYWEEYVSIIPQEERNDMISAYYKRLTSDDKAVRSEAAKRWSVWECSTSRLMIDPDYIKKAYEDDFSDKFARIECHYFFNGGWMRDGQLLEKAEIDKIRQIPAVIIFFFWGGGGSQRRRAIYLDTHHTNRKFGLIWVGVCPAKTAWELHQAWPEAELYQIADIPRKKKGLLMSCCKLPTSSKTSRFFLFCLIFSSVSCCRLVIHNPQQNQPLIIILPKP
ncbi:prolyl aminopeptidase [Puccinia sorghi]|uniref:Proline iminopeptidase n=1 Tax=Puccinia sorghi TaxID=27349 RepID=A0A0L6VQG0_9BASI|nr:prolyl aminopeptidase [Puccinia sorghi]